MLTSGTLDWLMKPTVPGKINAADRFGILYAFRPNVLPNSTLGRLPAAISSPFARSPKN